MASVVCAAASAGSIVTGAGRLARSAGPLNASVRPVASIAVRLKSSVTLPTTVTVWPMCVAARSAADSPPTKIPSEVAGFASWAEVGVST